MMMTRRFGWGFALSVCRETETNPQSLTSTTFRSSVSHFISSLRQSRSCFGWEALARSDEPGPGTPLIGSFLSSPVRLRLLPCPA